MNDINHITESLEYLTRKAEYIAKTMLFNPVALKGNPVVMHFYGSAEKIQNDLLRIWDTLPPTERTALREVAQACVSMVDSAKSFQRSFYLASTYRKEQFNHLLQTEINE